MIRGIVFAWQGTLCDCFFISGVAEKLGFRFGEVHKVFVHATLTRLVMIYEKT
jgi:hypothetical protein